ncbi:TetR/AcrR family transcriptional regulator [Sphingobacterium sp.]|uniref:TetR/AcrR family transcriptional regulator n=1 Tax=Sphingobacterium sp. TaxID=341027 RepID=UPI0031E059B4
MNTKEKIIETALRLYNQEGIRTVTTRQIAQEMGISAGNLHYHFKHTEDIIFTVFEQLRHDYDEMMVLFQKKDVIFQDLLLEFTWGSYQLINKYKFIFVNFVEICAWIPAIGDSYRNLVSQREEQFVSLFGHYSKLGMFRQDIPIAILKGFVRQIFIISDFWSSSFSVLGGRFESDAFEDYKRTVEVAFYPYLI